MRSAPLHVIAIVALSTAFSCHTMAQPASEGSKLPSGQFVSASVPGSPQPANSFPGTAVLSPDGRYVAILNDGWGTPSSGFAQSISILDVATRQLEDFPDPRFRVEAHQTYFDGLAFSTDGSKIYVSVGSITDPEGKNTGDLGNGIAVYSFAAGKVSPSGFLPIPLQPVPPGKQRNPALAVVPETKMVPYPAGLAVIAQQDHDELLVADNLADNLLRLDLRTGQILATIDLSANPHIPSSYPLRVIATRDGRTAFCSLWNSSEVVELDLVRNRIRRRIPLLPPVSPIAPGSHPSAMLFSPDQQRLYVAISNADRVAILDAAGGRVTGWLDARPPEQKFPGAFPTALSLDKTGKTLFVADANINAIAVFDLSHPTSTNAAISARGFLPTEWYPAALASAGDQLIVTAGKARGTGPNARPPLSKELTAYEKHPYLMELLRGSVAVIGLEEALPQLAALTREVVRNNALDNSRQVISFAAGSNPIRHVIYVIKENRTYDQVFGDLPQADGDPSLCLYCQDITPNEHKLARQFGILDNFYCSGNVSGDGHVWSMAATSSDYTERTWQAMQRGDDRTYDYEGDVDHDYPFREGIPDVNEPSSGYIWGNVARHGLSHRNYGEYIETQWCDSGTVLTDPKENHPLPAGAHCDRDFIKPGGALPNYLGTPRGTANPFPWPIPVLYRNNPTKPQIAASYDPRFPDFRLDYPDQFRADEFLNEFEQFVHARKRGKGLQLPRFVILRLGNDHTAGTRPGFPTPAALVADNDLALGRVVDALTHSPYFDDTAMFVVEDDAQDGADHVDAHRSTALVISKYSPGSTAKPFVDHAFYTTVSMIHTIESLLGLPPMNVNDAYSPLMAPLFTGHAEQEPFTADFSNEADGLIFKMNTQRSVGAAESLKMDFSHADAADPRVLNRVLWQDRKGADSEPPATNSGKQKGRESK
jgi:DNA-binding beta-propeller fold protein YncE